jgi:16S rRNA (uracil1498-N3)-methyltransferase
LDNPDFSKMKHPPRFAISDDTASRAMDGTVRVTGSELHHMRDVMRLRPGMEVMLCGADGLQYAGRIDSFEPDAAMVTVAPEPHNHEYVSPRLILAAGMIKAARMDLLIEKASELNASEFWPLMCAHSVVREPRSGRRERWRRISLAAAKQSLRTRTMEVEEPVDIVAMVSRVPKTARAVACIAGAEPLSAVIRRMAEGPKPCAAVVLAIGPEGDFSAEELAVMREASFVAAGLGKNRLRSETAALVALSITAGIFAELENTEPSSR